MDLLKTLYGVIGAPHPTLTLVIAALVGASLFGGGWWLIGKQYDKEVGKQSSAVQERQERQRPTAIKIKGGKNITIKNNVALGDMDLIDAENVENLDADKNILITPVDKKKK